MGLGLPIEAGIESHASFGDLDLLQQLLLGELLEQRGLAAPEDVGLRPALPLDDAPVGHRRARGDRVDLDGDVPLLLGVVGEGLERGVVDELRHRRDQRQLALDRRLGPDPRPRQRAALPVRSGPRPAHRQVDFHHASSCRVRSSPARPLDGAAPARVTPASRSRGSIARVNCALELPAARPGPGSSRSRAHAGQVGRAEPGRLGHRRTQHRRRPARRPGTGRGSRWRPRRRRPAARRAARRRPRAIASSTSRLW